MNCTFENYVKRVSCNCYKVIPLVFDNSLSYYETICGFAAKLNEIINTVNNQGVTIAEFTNMVNQAFNDYKTEINTTIQNINNDFTEFTDNITRDFNLFKEEVIAILHNITGIGKGIETGTEYIVDNVTYTAGTGAEIFNTYEGAIANKAAADYSHAEGSNTAALATGSHTEGLQTIATGNGSHAEGTGSKATAQGSHAENAVNIASGVNSHCGGNNSESGGVGSFVHGNHCESNTNYQSVFGQYNDSTVNHPFVIGNGAEGAAHNAFSIDSNGLVYINGAATGINIATMIVPITQTDYDNLSVKNPTTLYVIIPEVE